MTQAFLSTVGDELLDHPDADPAAVAVSLRHIAVANRWFGGWWAVRRGLARVTRRLGGSANRRLSGSAARLTLLDIGCGAGDLAAKTVAWGARRGLEIVPLGLERHRTAAALARRQRIVTLLGCAGQLPIRDKSVDIVLASQLIHHLTPEAIVAFCQEADRLARLGVVIADLRRSAWAMAGFWVGSRALRFDAATRADGLTSVRRGFHADELGQLLTRAGVPAQVERSAGFRLVATWQPGKRP
jgi:SAM-dependent methyltransferase